MDKELKSYSIEEIGLSLPKISMEDEIAIKFREFIRSFDNVDHKEVAIYIACYLRDNGINAQDFYSTSEIPLLDKK